MDRLMDPKRRLITVPNLNTFCSGEVRKIKNIKNDGEIYGSCMLPYMSILVQSMTSVLLENVW